MVSQGTANPLHVGSIPTRASEKPGWRNLVYAEDLKSSAARLVGSNPTLGTSGKIVR